ncbi:MULTISPECIES: ATP-grasp domain-containing protein [Myxococcaceae]|uniref:D-alanine--D-alanine ligase family protein n=1 Tax=Myxococcaceae TaxID=31 RepID=UPI0018905503|nr:MULTISPECIES: ATP-grasp domain-containing protein [Myxococcaceae]MBF5041916.1 ATP-grasp domain-containing protein [Simulacricoccus sp. 17bor-14]
MSANDVIILFGGTSDERRVSVASAQNVATVLPEAEVWFQAPDGSVTPCPRATLAAHQNAYTTDLQLPGTARWPSLDAALDAGEARGKTFFLALHGGQGEDGTTQRALERRGLAFTGSGSEASAKGFDKERAKALAAKAGVRTVESVELTGDAGAMLSALQGLLARHGRLVVKPIRGGSSVGLYHVKGPEDAGRAAREVAAQAPQVAFLAEAFVQGTELTVGVVDSLDGKRRALPCSEVRVDPGRAFDFEGKYLGKGTLELTPAEVPPDVFQAAQALAVTAHEALGCEGYTRTDIIVGARGPVYLETNTLPGLTKASFIPQQLAAEGTALRPFLEEQLALARARRDRQR